MCSCAHCANVCVALILVFPLTIPHLLPSSSLLTFDDYTLNPLLISNQTLFVYLCIIFVFLHFSTLHLSYSSPTPHHFHPSVHSLIHRTLITFGFLLPTPLINPLLFSFTSHLWSLALPCLLLPHPVHLVLLLPSSLPFSLSHSALCLALSGWAAPRWLRVCVHSGACRASPPPGLTTRFCLSPLNSAAPLLPSLPPSPSPHHSLFFAHSTRLLIPPWCRQHPLTPSHPPTSSPSVVLSSL